MAGTDSGRILFSIRFLELEILEQISKAGSDVLRFRNLHFFYRFFPVSYTHLDVYKRQVLECQDKRSEGMEAYTNFAEVYDTFMDNLPTRHKAHCP